MSGWYLMHRGWQDNPVFANEPYGERDAWLWLIEKAVWKDTVANVNGNPVPLKRGQLTFSVRYLADAWSWHKNKVTRFLEKLKKWDMIVSETGTGQQIITICNYDTYQTDGDSSGTAVNQKPGQDGDRTGTNKKEIQNNKRNKEDTPLPPQGEPFALPDWLPAETWQAYLNHRGKSFTPNAQRLAIGKLERWRTQGHDPTEILENSIMNGWKGLFEPKEKHNGSRQQKPTYHERIKAAGDAALEQIFADIDAEFEAGEGGSAEGTAGTELRRVPRLQPPARGNSEHGQGHADGDGGRDTGGNQPSLPALDAGTFDPADTV